MVRPPPVKTYVTTHPKDAVLDSGRGKPAKGVAVRLEELVGNEGFKPLAQGYVSFHNVE